MHVLDCDSICCLNNLYGAVNLVLTWRHTIGAKFIMNRIQFSILLLVTLLLSSFSTFGYAAELLPVDLPKAEIIRLGERMYRDGILPSGAPLTAFIRGDVEVDSSAFSCSSCHMRAGLGSVEGGVVTPPTTGNKLYQPYLRPSSLDDIPDRTGRYVYAKTVSERPAYTRDSLATALRFGTDPAGQVFNDVMPRYPLSDSDMSILIAYLEELSSGYSPGATLEVFAFATIITDDVSPADRAALLQPLQTFINGVNEQMDMYDKFIYFNYTPTIDMKNAFRRATLDIWELKGALETWPRQLADYAAKKPVFAVLGGISNRDWQPIHNFCEAQRLPCLFPITDYPVISESSWYSYYFNKGFYQEGEAVARYLNRDSDLPASSRILQIVQDSPAGKTLASGFNTSWSQLEHPDVTSLSFSAQQLRDTTNLYRVIKQYKPAIILLWSDDSPTSELPELLTSLAAPARIFVSSSYLGAKTLSIPDAARAGVFMTYPYRLTPFTGTKEGADSKVPILASAKDFGKRRITTRTITMLMQSALQGLRRLQDNLYRDYMLDVMSMQMDQVSLDYERLSFGPGQRYISKGCYIIQLGKGSEPALIPRSDWVVH